MSSKYLVNARDRITGNGFNMLNLKSDGSFPALLEECYSEENPGWRNLVGGKGDVGGPFFVLRNKLEAGLSDTTQRRVYPWPLNPQYDIDEYFTGAIWPCDLSLLAFPTPINSDESQMNMWGAEAVAKAAPGGAPMNIAVSLGELKKDGLPSMIGSTFKSRTGKAKAAGDEYLNAQFGWAPLLRDVKSLAKTYTTAADLLNQLERDSGQIVRRRVTLQEGWESLGTESLGYQVPSLTGIGGGFIADCFPGGQLKRQVRQYRKVWFSGAFTYYLPKEYYSRNQFVRGAAQANALYGLEVNPTTLWNLAPWSWAADWFSNAGEVISNTQRFLTEGLVMHHGYLMEHTIHEYTYMNFGSNVPVVRLITETKGRVKANPFGFGLDWPDLSGYQVSILAALGMSRRG